MDTTPAPTTPNIPDEENDKERKSLGDLRSRLETGQGMSPPVGEEAINENRSQPLANPRIQTPNVGNIKAE